MIRKLFFLLLAGLAVQPAYATPAFDWFFNPASYNVAGPNFSVEITATLTNTGSTTFDSVDLEGATFMTPFITGFGFRNAPINTGSPLAPGQSVNFDFLILIFTDVPPGMYMPLDSASITLDDSTGAETKVFATNTPELIVTPEPSAFFLMATGAVGLLGMVRRRA